MREFDLILVGATGFTGRLVAEHIATVYGFDAAPRWAIAGRSIDRLEQVRVQLGAGEGQLPCIVADSLDDRAMIELAGRTRVVCSTVGPYARYGRPLVSACAGCGTHYCDLSGEVPWMADMILRHQDRAEASGARLVHSCGFDSVPSDLGTWFVQQAMMREHGVPAGRVRGRVGRTRGAASGGTVASLLGVLEDAGRDRRVRRIARDPYALYPPGVEPGVDGADRLGAHFDTAFDQWTGPFVMASINTRVVRRSNAVLGFPWGSDFRYDEAQLCRSRGRALGLAAASRAAFLGLALGPTRRLAERFLPAPGDGPDARSRERGFFEMFFHAEHPGDTRRHLRARVTGDRDPGYGATSRMLAEAAVSLAVDNPGCAGGFWTPASAFGDALIERLRRNAGMTFDLV